MQESKKTIDGTMYAIGILFLLAAILLGTAVSCTQKPADKPITVTNSKASEKKPNLLIVGEVVIIGEVVDPSTMQPLPTPQQNAPESTTQPANPEKANTTKPLPVGGGGGGGGTKGAPKPTPDPTPTPTPIPKVKQGQTVTVSVLVNAINSLEGAQFDLLYNSSLLSYQSVSEGPFLDSGNANDAMLLPPTRNTAGAVRSIVLLRVVQPGVSGSGTIATLTFTAIADGDPSFTLQNVLLSDSQAQPLPNSVSTQYAIQ